MSRSGDPDKIALQQGLAAGAAKTAPLAEMLTIQAERVVTAVGNRGNLCVNVASASTPSPVSESHNLTWPAVNATFPVFCAEQWFDFTAFNLRQVSYQIKIAQNSITHIRVWLETGGLGQYVEHIFPLCIMEGRTRITSDPTQWGRVMSNLTAPRGALRRIGFSFADESSGAEVALHLTGWREL